MSLHHDLIRKIKVIAIKQNCPYFIVVDKNAFPMEELKLVAQGLGKMGVPTTFMLVDGDVRKSVHVTMFEPSDDGTDGKIIDITDNKEIKNV